MISDTVKTLCYLSGVSGTEDEVRDYILERVMPYADKLVTDVLGSVLVFKKGAVTPKSRIMLCAHMDEVGVIVTGITDEGYLRFDAIGSIDRRVIIGKRVNLGSDRISGVIGIKAKHLTSAEEAKNIAKIEDLYIDIGADDRGQAEEYIKLGDTGVFEDNITELGEGYLAAKAIDDRIGCAIMLELIESPLPCDTWFAFTAQEEVGARGASNAAFALNPDIALILEGTTAVDIPGVPEGKEVCRLGGGVVIPFMDRGTIYNPELRDTLIKLAEENGIKWQTKEYVSGATDAAAIQRSRAGVKTAGLAVGVRNLHSPACVAKISDFEDMQRLSAIFLESFRDSVGDNFDGGAI